MIQRSKYLRLLRKRKKLSGKDATLDIASWNEYRFYTSGTLTKILLGDRTVIGIEDKNGKQTFIRSVTNKKEESEKNI